MSLFNYLFGDRPKVDARVGRPIEMPPAGPDGGSVNAPPPELDRYTFKDMPPEMYGYAAEVLQQAGGNLIDWDKYEMDMRKEIFRQFDARNPKGFSVDPRGPRI